MEKTCKKCGKVLPLEMLPVQGGYRRSVCKTCVNKNKNEWRKKHGYTEEERAKASLKLALKREENKARTGKVYRNEKDAENRRAYAKKYQAEHKEDPKHIEMRNRCYRNYAQRRKIMEEVEFLSEFFTENLDF